MFSVYGPATKQIVKFAINVGQKANPVAYETLTSDFKGFIETERKKADEALKYQYQINTNEKYKDLVKGTVFKGMKKEDVMAVLDAQYQKAQRKIDTIHKVLDESLDEKTGETRYALDLDIYDPFSKKRDLSAGSKTF